MTHRLCLFHTLDPRGAKVGGIETHVRHILHYHPQDFSVLLVGIDEIGDCALGTVRPVAFGDRTIDFLPVARRPTAEANAAAKALSQSTTLRFALGALRHLPAIRRAIGGGPASADLHRYEFALIAKLLRLPAIQMVHQESRRTDVMDSVMHRYWLLHEWNERVALRLARHVFGVNEKILQYIRSRYPEEAGKLELLTCSVDMGLFSAEPFDCRDDVLRIVFAGRLDEFKDPRLMFATVERLHERLSGRVEFHYVGSTDTRRFPEFDAIRPFSIVHGVRDARGVAAILRRCHAAILTSHFEGLPCFLIEALAAGRPFGAIRLPQYEGLIVEGVSGTMVDRADDPDQSAERLADAFVALWNDIKGGAVDPQGVRGRARPYCVTRQIGRIFDWHRRIQGGDGRLAEEPAASPAADARAG